LISDSDLRRIIIDLQSLERKCFASRSRFAFYDYLAGVFEFYVQLRRKKQTQQVARLIAQLFGLQNRKHAHPIRVIIDATSTADEKTKSRWTRALRFAWHERGRWGDMKIFLNENGGPAGCAASFTALTTTKQDASRVVYRCPGTSRPYLVIQKD
jgi:hypothetical protein